MGDALVPTSLLGIHVGMHCLRTSLESAAPGPQGSSPSRGPVSSRMGGGQARESAPGSQWDAPFLGPACRSEARSAQDVSICPAASARGWPTPLRYVNDQLPPTEDTWFTFKRLAVLFTSFLLPLSVFLSLSLGASSVWEVLFYRWL